MKKVIDEARKSITEQRITVTGLAEKCGCTRQHIYQILSGVQHPSAPLMEKIANALGLEITVKKASKKKTLRNR